MNVTELEQQDKEIREAEAWKGVERWAKSPRGQTGDEEGKELLVAECRVLQASTLVP